MNQKERDVRRKLRILKHTEENGHVAMNCRYFGVARASFYRWKSLYKKDGEAGLVNKKSIPQNPINRTPPRSVREGSAFAPDLSSRAHSHRLISRPLS